MFDKNNNSKFKKSSTYIVLYDIFQIYKVQSLQFYFLSLYIIIIIKNNVKIRPKIIIIIIVEVKELHSLP